MRISARMAWEFGSTAVVAVVAVTMLGFYLRDRRATGSGNETALTVVEEWQEWSETAIRIGPANAKMVVATFMDLSCPVCKQLSLVLDSLTAQFPETVAIEFIHFPLKGRRTSVPKAVAAECGERQGRFAEVFQTLYARMDSLKESTWVEVVAREAGVEDVPGFQACAQLPAEDFQRIAAGRALGDRLGVTGTPKVWVNGRLFRGRSLNEFRARARELGL